jgi:hypothetical protein
VPDVFLHIGLPKTGTTSIQAAMDASVDSLARAGILVPAGGHRGQRVAVYDLFGNRTEGGDSRGTPGAFAALMTEVRSSDLDRVLISEEDLGVARPRHVRRVVRSLEGRPVHVVIGVRDLARTLASAWQQAVVMGSTIQWHEFVDAVRDPDDRSLRAGLRFAMSHDVLRVLDVWGTAVPPDRIHVVTVPPAGSPPTLLLERFALATGIPAAAWRTDVTPRNDSLGVAEVETLRRLNVRLAGELPAAQYRFVIEHGIRARWQLDGSRRLQLPSEDHGWVQERSEALIAELARRGHEVTGDLDDLRPRLGAAETARLDELTDAELLTAAEGALTSLALAHGQLFRRFRRRFSEEVGRTPTLGEVVASNGRAAWFRVQKQGLASAEGRPVLAAGVRRLARFSGPGRLFSAPRRASRPGRRP